MMYSKSLAPVGVILATLLLLPLSNTYAQDSTEQQTAEESAQHILDSQELTDEIIKDEEILTHVMNGYAITPMDELGNLELANKLTQDEDTQQKTKERIEYLLNYPKLLNAVVTNTEILVYVMHGYAITSIELNIDENRRIENWDCGAFTFTGSYNYYKHPSLATFPRGTCYDFIFKLTHPNGDTKDITIPAGVYNKAGVFLDWDEEDIKLDYYFDNAADTETSSQ